MQGPMDSGSHQIFVWDVAARGQFLKTIENGKEPLVDMDVRLNPRRATNDLENPDDPCSVASTPLGDAKRDSIREDLHMG